MPDNGIENVRMVCDESGRCWRQRGQRRVVVEDSYNTCAPRERYIERRGYYDDGYYKNGPSVGFGVGPRWQARGDSQSTTARRKPQRNPRPSSV